MVNTVSQFLFPPSIYTPHGYMSKALASNMQHKMQQHVSDSF